MVLHIAAKLFLIMLVDIAVSEKLMNVIRLRFHSLGGVSAVHVLHEVNNSATVAKFVVIPTTAAQSWKEK